jgi:hypothetical protein
MAGNDGSFLSDGGVPSPFVGVLFQLAEDVIMPQIGRIVQL